MNLRLKRTVSVAAVSLVALAAYHVAAVRLIEPQFDDPADDSNPPPPFVDQAPRSLAPYFAAGSWELDNPTKIEGDRSKLLFKKYENVDSNHVRLEPCAILFFPNGEAPGATSQRVIVLEAPKAILQFEGTADVQKMKFGQFQGGKMIGPIAIHGTPSRPAANDEIFADTPGDLQLTPELLSTDAPVNFRYGPNEGHGRQLRIHLLPSDRPQGKRGGANIGGIHSLELLHDVVMRLVPGTSGMMPLDARPQHTAPKPAAVAAPVANPRMGPPPIPNDEAPSRPSVLGPAAGTQQVNSEPQPPVDIRCQGPFNFDVSRSIATFEDHVDVVRIFPGGVTDRMTSDALSVYFAPKTLSPSAAAAGAAPANPSAANAPKPSAADASNPRAASNRTSNLEPRRIEARGNTVILRAESNGVYARAAHIDYDIVTGRVVLDDERELILQQFVNAIHCRSLEYTPGEPGRLGRLEAIGPGWLRAIPRQASAMPNGRPHAEQQPLLSPSAPIGVTQLGLPVVSSHRPPQTVGQFFEAHWTQKLTMRPEGGEHVVSILGDARAGMTGEGELAADQIYLWLREVPVTDKSGIEQAPAGAPSATPRWQVVADKLLARPNVRVDSPQLSGSTGLLEAWFEQAGPQSLPARAPNAFAGPNEQPGAALSRQATPAVPPTIGTRGPLGPGLAAGADPRTAQPPRQPQQHFDVFGDHIMVKFLTSAPRTEVQDITIDGRARFGESQTTVPGEVPLLVTGEQIEVLKANAPDTLVTVTGKPAEVAARGLEMYGDVVHLDKGSNRAWIDMPGHMKLPASQSAALASPSFAAAPNAMASSSAYPPVDKRFAVENGTPPSIMRPAAPADPMIVTWKDRMVFDGRTAHFEHAVEGESKSRHFKTDLLDVSLRRRIDFAQPRMEEQVKIDRIDCQGGMWMETRSFDPYDPEKLLSLDRMQTRDLSINETTGEIFGHGAGWLTSIRRGLPDPAHQNRPPAAFDSTNRPSSLSENRRGLSPFAAGTTTVVGEQKGTVPLSADGSRMGIKATTVAQTGPAPTAKPASGRHRSSRSGGLLSEKSQLNYLNVQFDGPLSGNINLHEIVFHDRVRSVYGPIMSWEDQLNPDDTDDLGDGGALMTCDLLKVRQTNDKPPSGAADRHPIELEAIGNASVEGEQYRATGYRMTYTESKDLLILEGDGRSDAWLYRQEHPGDPRADTNAKTIYVYFGHAADGSRSIRQVSVKNPSFVELNQLPGQAAATAAPDSKPADPKANKRGAKQ
jgi:hypothetical protein